MTKSFSHRLSIQLQRYSIFNKVCSKSSAAELSYEGKGWAIYKWPIIAIFPIPMFSIVICYRLICWKGCTRTLTYLPQLPFENIVTKGEIAHNEQFLLLPQYFQLCSLHMKTFSMFLPRCFQSRLLQICCLWKGLNRNTFITDEHTYFFRKSGVRSVSLYSCLHFSHLWHWAQTGSFLSAMKFFTLTSALPFLAQILFQESYSL